MLLENGEKLNYFFQMVITFLLLIHIKFSLYWNWNSIKWAFLVFDGTPPVSVPRVEFPTIIQSRGQLCVPWGQAMSDMSNTETQGSVIFQDCILAPFPSPAKMQLSVRTSVRWWSKRLQRRQVPSGTSGSPVQNCSPSSKFLLALRQDPLRMWTPDAHT